MADPLVLGAALSVFCPDLWHRHSLLPLHFLYIKIREFFLIVHIIKDGLVQDHFMSAHTTMPSTIQATRALAVIKDDFSNSFPKLIQKTELGISFLINIEKEEEAPSKHSS